jgi:hypothetical protein
VRRVRWFCVAAPCLLVIFGATSALAQSADSTAATAIGYKPNSGFKVISTDKGDLNIRIYTYVRYLNQLGLDPTYTDSFGKTSTLDRRQDILFQKVVLYFQGWLMSPKFRYLTYVWTSNTSQGLGAQVVVGGNVNYVFGPHFTLGAGIDALPSDRATEGNFPFWLTVDNRLMADEFFRGSYTMGIMAKGNIVDHLKYRFMLGNNLSQLGVDAGQLDNKLNTVSMGLIWLPTTGEFGTQGGFGDFDRHEQIATRLAAHYTSGDENRQGQPNTDSFENVQIRLSDGNPIFTPDLFGPGIQVEDATYHMFCTDGGIKYRGFSLDAEYYWRWVNHLRGPGTESLTFQTLTDNGFQLQASGMVVPETFQAYTGLSKIYGEYGNPWDLRLGLNWFPWRNYVVRWNLEYLYTERNPVGGLSMPMAVGSRGNIVYSSFQVNF